MNRGTQISGAAHLLLVAWVLLGGLFNAPKPRPMQVTDVTILSGEEFAALTAPAAAPQAPAQQVETPRSPVVTSSPRPAPAPERRPEPPAPPPPQESPAPDPAPDTSALQPPPEAEVTDTLPPLVAPPPVSTTAPEAPVADTAPPRPSQRVAPEPAAPRPEDVAVAPQPREAVRPDVAAPTPAPPVEAAAPEEAAPQIVTEAEERVETGQILASSPRPRVRPERPPEPVRETAATPPPAPAPTPTPAPTPAPTPEPVRTPDPTPPAPDALADAVAGALADAMASGAAETPRAGTGTAASGPPMTAGERDALRIAVANCWNVGALSTEAMMTSVIVALEMREDGRPVIESIRLVSFSGGSDMAARQVFDSARRAIVMCGSSGFPLPVEKYDQWRQIEMTFNPENMRIR
ncbi:energy transducer TonB [Rhodovulum strictum]|uniref:Energy transducer TonB n=1 Tax=Rhodovulum strictum TaxID=58314 RepID=A0A844B6V6_9RHOB|nr:energy transducer TonB [Rhodovulum strictum]MRH20114.1 energy transducer TonB [Rhodovulum strictum]